MNRHLINHFIAFLQQQERTLLTPKGYPSDLSHFAHWFETTHAEILTLAGITPTDVRQYRQHMLRIEKCSAHTIKRRLATLTGFLDWGVHTGQIEYNRGQDVQHVPNVPEGPKYLDQREQAVLQRTLEKDVQYARLRYPKRWMVRQRDASLVTFLLHTGLRLQEALALCLEDVQLTAQKGQMLVRGGKGGKQGIVPLNTDARQALQKWLAIRPESYPDAHVWIPIEGTYTGGLSSRSVQRMIQRYGQEAGLDHLTPHMLRHTFGKNLVDSGVGLETVAALLGHANLNTTRRYLTPNQHDLEDAVEQISTQN
ncbi:MAG TPA: tyrosine-type recombinase/integrase [Anaerolineales bacterium]|nr:tyrosine-type recombinase/integrase [Anaerolineales bacterium]